MMMEKGYRNFPPTAPATAPLIDNEVATNAHH
jgi:hypothetical protein